MVPEKFGPQEIWSPRIWGPKKFGPCMKMPHNDFHAGTNFFGDHFSYIQRFSITDSVHELTIGHRRRISMPKFEQKRSSLVIIVAQISTTAAAAVIEHHMQP